MPYPKLCARPCIVGSDATGPVAQSRCMLPLGHAGWCIIRPLMIVFTPEHPNGMVGVLMQINPETLEVRTATQEQYSERFRSTRPQ